MSTRQKIPTVGENVEPPATDAATEARIARAIPFLPEAIAVVIANATPEANAYPLEDDEQTRDLLRSIAYGGIQNPPARNGVEADGKVTKGRRRLVCQAALNAADKGGKVTLRSIYCVSSPVMDSVADYVAENSETTRRKMTPQQAALTAAKLRKIARARYEGDPESFPFSTVPRLGWLAKMLDTNEDYIRAAYETLADYSPQIVADKIESGDLNLSKKKRERKTPTVGKKSKPTPDPSAGKSTKETALDAFDKAKPKPDAPTGAVITKPDRKGKGEVPCVALKLTLPKRPVLAVEHDKSHEDWAQCYHVPFECIDGSDGGTEITWMVPLDFDVSKFNLASHATKWVGEAAFARGLDCDGIDVTGLGKRIEAAIKASGMTVAAKPPKRTRRGHEAQLPNPLSPKKRNRT